MNYKALLFDLDDTLLDRDKAVDELFYILLKKCYKNTNDSTKQEMLHKFKEYDKRSYGISDKTRVIESLFEEFPPNYVLQHNDIQEFWDYNFPLCFSKDENIISIVNRIKKHVKVAIITNGSTKRQKAKIMNSHLHNCFDLVIISEEVGLRKPDKRIFELALTQLNVKPEDALFVGDDLEIDMGGCQNVQIKGIWFNPDKRKNATGIKPNAEIHSLDTLLSFFPGTTNN